MPCVLSLTQNCPEVENGDEFPVSLPSVTPTVCSRGTTVKGRECVLAYLWLLAVGQELMDMCSLLKACAPEPNP